MDVLRSLIDSVLVQEPIGFTLREACIATIVKNKINFNRLPIELEVFLSFN